MAADGPGDPGFPLPPSPVAPVPDPAGALPEARRERASALITRFAESLDGPRVTLGQITSGLGDRAFGVVLLLLAVPNLIPMAGLSAIFGLPLALVGGQMALGCERIWLPRRLAALSVERTLFQSLARRTVGLLGRIEPWLRPRWPALSGRRSERVLGGMIVILGIVLALPIPLGNQPPGVAIILMALGLIEHDGAFVAGGFVTALVSLVIVAAVIGAAAAALLFVGQSLTN